MQVSLEKMVPELKVAAEETQKKMEHVAVEKGKAVSYFLKFYHFFIII